MGLVKWKGKTGSPVIHPDLCEDKSYLRQSEKDSTANLEMQ